MKWTIQNITIIVLLVLLLISVYFLWIDKYQIITQEEQESLILAAMQEGAQKGYERAVVSLMTEATKCEPVPVYYNNQTVSMIAVECLQR